MPQPIAVVFHEGTVTTFARNDEPSFSTFGGPLELEVVGAVLPQPLHQIVHFSHDDLKRIAPSRFIWDLPLLYGMNYNECTLKYQFEVGKIDIQSLSPHTPDEDWPYRNYPAILPYYPIVEVANSDEAWSEFTRRAPNLPEGQPAELVVLVPPPVGLGFTLWGRDGDAEGVTLVFECDLTAKLVSAYNVCS